MERNTKKCNFENCKKKLGIISYKCNCGSYYCRKHRYSWMHNCNYNFKEHGRIKLMEENNKIIADKIINRI